MNPAEIIGLTVGGIAILSAVLGGVLWLIKAQVAMSREFKPNGGSSTRDSLNRIEKDVREIRTKIDDQQERLSDHLEWHMDQR